MIILFGYSKLAAQTAYRLNQEKQEFIIIEPNKKQRDFAINDNYTNTIYDYECYDDEQLISLGIKKESTRLFCMHKEFNKNLFITLSARNLNNNLQIISYCTNHNNAKKLKLAGATITINPYETAGLKIFRTIHKPIAVKILDNILYHNTSLDIQEIKITKNSLLNNKKFNEIKIIEEYNLIILGIQDKEISNEFIFSSRGINHKIDEGDVIVVLGHTNDIQNFINKIN